MSYEIIALDIDGTLTNSQKEITPKTLEALLRIQKAGKKVVLASGRPTPGLAALANQLQLDQFGGYLLAYNGAKIINYKTKEVIFNQTVPLDMIPKLYDFAAENEVGIITYNPEGVISGRAIDDYIAYEARLNGIPVREETNFKTFVNFPVNKCLMTGEANYMAQMEEKLKGLYGDILNIYRSEAFFLEIMPQNVDKANSLSHLLDHLGLAKDQLIACGDGYNDMSMIEYAGLGVAMANAKDEIKAVANHITLSNDEDGVAAVIDQYM